VCANPLQGEQREMQAAHARAEQALAAARDQAASAAADKRRCAHLHNSCTDNVDEPQDLSSQARVTGGIGTTLSAVLVFSSPSCLQGDATPRNHLQQRDF